ncbi:unnamed protein product [Medioppia subpectinata]|uniref:Androgen-dependent TFPI-regulating protein n=1 Tax=Medioppia subpectinata TaxID=1979941 RepID=A0A7R9KSF1_9ACAR|nr:unnamed protein product [Medioppia subpectinata]CAG2107763.1 unnamed protein product [Medioppia subpectinata]
MSSVRSYVLSVLVHMSATIVFGYSLYWCYTNPDIPTKNPRGSMAWRYKYLTFWDLWLQFIAFSLCLLSDILGQQSISSGFVRLRDIVFNSLALPIGFFVVTTFWAIYAFNRELVFPTGVEKWYPSWLNHTTHSIILPLLLLESYLVRHSSGRQRTAYPLLLLSVVIVYLLWVLYIAFKTDHWVYGVLEVLNWPSRAVFFAGCASLMLSFFYVGVQLNALFWGTEKTPKPKSEQNRRKVK